MVVPAFVTRGVVLVLWTVGAILENWYGIPEQNYVAMYRENEM